MKLADAMPRFHRGAMGLLDSEGSQGRHRQSVITYQHLLFSFTRGRQLITDC